MRLKLREPFTPAGSKVIENELFELGAGIEGCMV